MIEYNEDLSWDLRSAYHERITDGLAELKQERAAGSRRRIYIHTRCYAVRDASDRVLEECARRDAERACNRADHERRIAMHRERARKGMAW